jgi:hypothetical protein
MLATNLFQKTISKRSLQSHFLVSTRYNILPTVACAYHVVFSEPLRGCVLIKSVNNMKNTKYFPMLYSKMILVDNKLQSLTSRRKTEDATYSNVCVLCTIHDL